MATYSVTAIDGIGGESPPVTVTTAGIGATGSPITLTWNGIPSAFAYNVYRSEDGVISLLATGPGAQPCGVPPGSTAPTPTVPAILPIRNTCGGNSLAFTYIDDGSAIALSPMTVNLADVMPQQQGMVQFTVDSTAGIPPSQSFTLTGNTNNMLNGAYITTRVVNATTFQAIADFALLSSGSGVGGTIAFAPPAVSGMSATALFKIPASSSLEPESYDNANIIALFPAPVQRLGVAATAGQAQVATAGQTAGVTGVPILGSPGGLVPFRNQIDVINTIADGTVSVQFRVGVLGFPGIAPTSLHVGDVVTVANVAIGGFESGNPYTVNGIGTVNGQHTAINLIPQAGAIFTVPTVIPPTGYVQYEIIAVNTTVPYTAAVGSLQTIKGSLEMLPSTNYNGTWRVRVGVTNGQTFFVGVPGFPFAQNSGGGTVSL